MRTNRALTRMNSDQIDMRSIVNRMTPKEKEREETLDWFGYS